MSGDTIDRSKDLCLQYFFCFVKQLTLLSL